MIVENFTRHNAFVIFFFFLKIFMINKVVNHCRWKISFVMDRNNMMSGVPKLTHTKTNLDKLVEIIQSFIEDENNKIANFVDYI